MDNKRKKELYLQISVGIIAMIFGALTSIYGYLYLKEIIRGRVEVVVILLFICLALITTNVILTLRSLTKSKKDKEKKNDD